MDRSSIASAILDPRTKLSVFSEENKQNAREHIQAIFEIYREHSSDAQSPARRLSSSTTNVTRQFFTQLRHNPTTPQVVSSPLVSELDRYLALQIDEETEPLLWWQAHTKEYPIVSNMARDYLTIQATSVPSEQAFSIAGNTINKTRNRLLPETARACLCMKSWIVNKMIELGI
jgi:hAT family C-terminal dimerisation region